MCDEFTAEAENAALARQGLSRRRFGILGATAALVACAGNGKAKDSTLAESSVEIVTLDGKADAMFVHPAQGKHPGVILWPDIGGLRPSFAVMARRLARAGYAVLAVNQYYRSAPAPVLTSFSEWRTPEGQALLRPMIAAITPDGTMRDGAAFAKWLDGQTAVDKARKLGTQGYCMGGPHAVRTGAAAPERVGAVASFHGASLVGDDPNSPVRLLARTTAEFLFAIGRNDDQKAPADKEALRQAAATAGRPAEIEVYPADHGWCVPDSPVYDEAQADRAWKRLALYARL